jgi:hypothetical protein
MRSMTLHIVLRTISINTNGGYEENLDINKAKMNTENKKLEELTLDEMKDLKIEFAPGCFDNFEGTQEELDELMSSITEMFRTGEAKNARRLDLDDLDDEDMEMLKRIYEQESQAKERKLQ